MPGQSDYPRSYRVADQIHRDLVQIVRDELRDPRIGPLVTISSVDVTRDLSLARVYVTTLGDEDRDQLMKAFQKASGFLRSTLGKHLRLRVVPELRFFYDETNEKALQMDELIRSAIASDSQASAEANRPDDDESSAK